MFSQRFLQKQAFYFLKYFILLVYYSESQLLKFENKVVSYVPQLQSNFKDKFTNNSVIYYNNNALKEENYNFINMKYSSFTDNILKKKSKINSLTLNNIGINLYEMSSNFEYKANLNEETYFYYNTTNSQFGTSFFELENIYFNKKWMNPYKEYAKNYTLYAKDSYSVAPFDRNIQIDNNNNTIHNDFIYQASCRIETHPKQVKAEYLEFENNNFKFKTIVGFRGNSIGIPYNSKGVFLIKQNLNSNSDNNYNSNNYLNSNIQVISLYNYIKDNKENINIDLFEYSNLFVIDDFYSVVPYLVLVSKNNLRMFYFELLVDEDNNIIDIFKRHDIYYNEKLNSARDIYSVAILKEEHLFIGADSGFFILTPNNRLKPEELSTEEYNYLSNGEIKFDIDYGLRVMRHYTQFKYWNGFVKLVPLNIIIIENVIHLAVKDYGYIMLNQYSKFSYSFNEYSRYEIPEIVQMDIVTNPITNVMYLGLLSNNKDEFFTEIMLQKYDIPTINKVFRLYDPISSSNSTYKTIVVYDEEVIVNYDNKDLQANFKSMLTNDNYYSYIYNSKNNDIIVIRRGMENNVPYRTSTIPLNKDFKDLNLHLFSLYNKNTSLNEVAILLNLEDSNFERNKDLNNVTKNNTDTEYNLKSTQQLEKEKLQEQANVRIEALDNKVYVFKEITDYPDTLVCKFNNPGTFDISILKVGEACKTSISNNYAFSYCSLIQKITINVVGPDLSDITIMGIVLGSVLFTFLLVLLVFFTVKTQCCTDFKFFRPKKPIPSKDEIYFFRYKKQFNKGKKGNLNDFSNENFLNIEKNIKEKEKEIITPNNAYGNYINDIDNVQYIYSRNVNTNKNSNELAPPVSLQSKNISDIKDEEINKK